MVEIIRLYRLKPLFLSACIAGLLVSWNTPAVSGKTLDFAVIQPGQPGDAVQAQPVMDALALYVKKKLGDTVSIKGHYFNQLEEALRFMEKTPPAWGIVRLGFYAAEAVHFGMSPIASTLPAGVAVDRWRLVTQKNGPDDWRSLHGEVLGNMLFEQEAAACLLFEKPVQTLPFQLKGTCRPLKSLRQVAKGKAAGVVVDGIQYGAVKSLTIFDEIKVIHTSRELPSDPVVWMGKPDQWTEKIFNVLMGMRNDPDAASLLRMLQTEGFGPANTALPFFKKGKSNDGCF